MRHLRRSKRAMALVVVAELLCGGIVLTVHSGPWPRPAAPGRVSAIHAPGPRAPSVPSTAGGGAGPASASGGGSPASTPTTEPAAAVTSPPVACQTDLALSQAPDTGYDFLCQQGSRPLTWDKDQVVFYTQGLTLQQQTAFAVAVGQWEAVARFQVAYTADRQAADVVVTDLALDGGQPGYTEDGYTTDSYRCAPQCAYYHAVVELSSTATLSPSDWVSTELHELGHVAGLNHVSQIGEVMYPDLTLSSPAAYAAGDRAGLAILAAERSA